MSMFQNPNYLNLARQFLSTPGRAGSPYAGRFPDTQGFAKTPYGQGLLNNLMARMAARRGGAPARRRPQAGTPTQRGAAQRPAEAQRRYVPEAPVSIGDFLRPQRPTLSNTGRRR